LKEELELRGAPVKVIVHDEVVEDEEPMVCRLTAGGRWIRTIGPRSPVSSVGAACRSCPRGSGSGSALLYPRLEPLRRAGLGYGLSRLWLAALRGGFRHLAVQLIYTFFSSFYRRARCRAAWLFIESVRRTCPRSFGRTQNPSRWGSPRSPDPSGRTQTRDRRHQPHRHCGSAYWGRWR